VALSHTHFDHSGNIKLFPDATWILQKAEYEFIQREPLNFAVLDNTFKLLSDKSKILLEYDIFSDATVKIVSTPGHQSLQLTLSNHGVII